MKTAILILALLTAAPLSAQQRTDSKRKTGATSERPSAADVVLDVPDLRVDNISLDVQRLDVQLALDARVANLVRLNAGADAGIDRVRLEIVGVQAEAYLVVRLDQVSDIVSRALDTIDANPEIVTRLLESVDSAVGTVGEVTGTAIQPGGVLDEAVGTAGRTLERTTAPDGVLAQTINGLGQTVVRALDESGNIVERTLDATGRIAGERRVGSVSDLKVIKKTRGAEGRTVNQVRDSSGAMIEYTVNSSGRIESSRVVTPNR